MQLIRYAIRSQKTFFIGVVLFSLFLVLLWIPVGTIQAFGNMTNTSKACHICETVDVDIMTVTVGSSFGEASCEEGDRETPALSSISPKGEVQFEIGVVKGLLFWMGGCPHCLSVKTWTIPRLSQQFGGKLQITQVELKTPDEFDILFLIARNKGLDPKTIGVPFLIIGNDVLIGSSDIDQKAPTLIENYLTRGGVGYPDMPELEDFLSVWVPQSVETVTVTAMNNMTLQATPVPTAYDGSITIYLFWGDGCPHCETAKSFLENLTDNNPRLELKAYEVWYDEPNRELLFQMAAAHGFKPRVVPTIFIGERHWEGYNNQFRDEILGTISTCIQRGCVDAAQNLAMQTAWSLATDTTERANQPVKLPLFGMVNRLVALGFIVGIIFLVLLIFFFSKIQRKQK